MGFGVFLGTFCTSKKYPGARGRVAPVGKYPGPGRVGPGTMNPGARGWVTPGGKHRGPGDGTPENCSPAWRQANQPFGAG